VSSHWLGIDGVSKSFGGLRALSEFTCRVTPGEIVGIIGPNGSGKTTLFDVITGYLRADAGRASFRGTNLLVQPAWRTAGAGVSRSFQTVRLARRLSVLENVLLGFGQQPGENLLNVFLRPRRCAASERRNTEIAFSLLEQVGLAEKAGHLADALSYGQQKLLSLTCCLASRGELLLLDEPVSGVDPQTIDVISVILARQPSQGKTVVLIEHNMEVVVRLCSRVIFMDAGAIVCEGSPDEVRRDPRVIEACIA
jgi:ABC-type branched-subunit amino acid transport system ATPase component